MTRAIRPAALLLALALLIAPESRATAAPELRGWASAYAPGRMAEVVRYRLDNGLWRVAPPADWYTAAGYIATNDCSQVGRMMTLVDPAGREWRVLVGDCAGRDSADWMTDNRIIAELDHDLFVRLTAEHGRPLEIKLR